MLWRNDQELFDLARAELFSALIGDVLDANGYYHQFLPQEIKPLSPEMKIVGLSLIHIYSGPSPTQPCNPL